MFLGIEIGGTKLQLGLGHGDGHILSLWRGTVVPSDGSEGIRKQIEFALVELLAKANCERGQIRGVGIGFGGPTDDRTRNVIKSHQIAGWDSFPLADWVSNLVGAPAVLCNDADVAGLGEALFGAGKGDSPIFYITIGSGIGGGLIIDEKIYRGVGRGAAEIGHLLVHAEGVERDSYLTPLESVASGWALAEAGAMWVDAREHWDTPLRRLSGNDPERVTGAMVVEAARAGDKDALDVLYNARNALAQALCQLIVLLCPRRIVIGGGVSLIGDELLFDPLRQLVARDVFPPFAGLTEIVPAALGEEVVIHGALALARQQFGV
jgi:glucokinase